MPNVYKPGLLQIRPQYLKDPDSGDTPENVLWFLSGSTTTPTIANLQAIQTTFDGSWGAYAALWLATGLSYDGSVITDWSSATGLQSSSVGALTPVVGTHGAPTPPQVAILQSYQVTLRWRGGHFRSYYPYVGSSVITGTFNDTVAAATLASMAIGYDNMVSAMKTTGVLGGQTQMMYKNKNDVATATLYPIATFDISNIVATQRRRVRHVGRR